MKIQAGLTGMMAVMLLTGCVAKGGRTVPVSPAIPPVAAGVATSALDDATRLEQCRRELDALKTINGAVYGKRKQEFDALMSGAGIYTGVRGEVSTYTQQAVDAYYRYHADKLCADIAIDVLSNLAKTK